MYRYLLEQFLILILTGGGDLSDDYPDLTPDLGVLPLLNINIISCFDDDSDGLCNIVETNTGIYNGANDTGTDPNNADTDNYYYTNY